MPIYEFQCAKCGHQVELWMKFSDKPPAHCERCNGKMKKLISQSSFHLKGSGWYVTDYASKSRNSRTDSSPKSEAKSETKGETQSGTDSKKEAKSKD